MQKRNGKIKELKRKSAVVSNARENRSRVEHEYRTGDLVLIVTERETTAAKLAPPTEGPYEIQKVYKNGTVKIKRGSYNEVIHIRRIKPFYGG